MKNFKATTLKVVAVAYKRFKIGVKQNFGILEEWLLRGGGWIERFNCIY